MSANKNDGARARLFNGSRDYNQVAMNAGNEMLIDSLGDKSSTLLNLAKGIRSTLDEDDAQLIALNNTMDRGSDFVSKAKGMVSNIVDDPSAIGVMKIATTVFTSLCAVYFGGKIIFKFLF